MDLHNKVKLTKVTELLNPSIHKYRPKPLNE